MDRFGVLLSIFVQQAEFVMCVRIGRIQFHGSQEKRFRIGVQSFRSPRERTPA